MYEGSLASCSIAVIPSSSVRFVHSDIPFCCGVAMVVCSCIMPFFVKCLSHLCPMYSPPLSSRNRLILVPSWFLTRASKARYTLNASLLAFRRKTCLYRIWSSVNVIQYRYPDLVRTGRGPWMSDTISSSAAFARCVDLVGNGARCCFAEMQCSHVVDNFARPSDWSPWEDIQSHQIYVHVGYSVYIL